MYAICQFSHALNLIVMRHTKLSKGGGAVHVVYASDFGDDKTCATFCALFIVVHKHFGGASVKLTEAHKHR